MEQSGKVNELTDSVGKIESDYVTNGKLSSESTMLSSLIQQTVESILLTVEEGYAKQEGFDEYKQTIQTQLEIMAGEIVMNFTTTTEQITDVDGELQSKFTELNQYIKYSGVSIILGSSENNITLTIENDMIVFKKNGVQFGWWDGVDFHTGNIVVEVNERAQFGNFAFIPRSDGSLMFLKVGDE